MSNNTYPAIPDPQSTLASVTDSVRALKMSVETLTGQREGGPAIRRYNQLVAPTSANIGDVWQKTNDAGSLYIWNGDYWVDISNGRFSALEGAINSTGDGAPWAVDLQALIDEIRSLIAQDFAEVNSSIAEANNLIRSYTKKLQDDIDAANLVASNARIDLAEANSLNQLLILQTRKEADDAISDLQLANTLTTTLIGEARTEAEQAAIALQVSLAAAQADVDNALADLKTITDTVYTVQSNVAGNAAAITLESGARATAVNAIAGQILTINAQVGENSAAISEESVARVTTDSSLAAQVVTLDAVTNENVAKIQNETIVRTTTTEAFAAQVGVLTASNNNFNASITNEALARVTEDTVLAQRINNITISSQGGFQAAIDAEALARANADSALAQTINTVDARAQAQRVFNQSTAPSSVGRIVGDIWFDSSDGFKQYYWNGTAWTDASDYRFAIIDAKVTSETTARVTQDSALASQIDSLSAITSGNAALINNETVARSSRDEAFTSDVLSMQTTVANNQASFNNQVATLTTADISQSTAISSLLSSVGQNDSNISQEIISRTTSDTSLASDVSGLKTNVNGNTAALNNQQVAFSTATDTIAAQILTLGATVGQNTAGLNVETSARASADSAFSTQVASLTTSVNGNTAGFSDQIAALTLSDASQSTQISSLNASFGDNSTKIDRETIARVTGDTSLATDITKLNTNVDGYVASVTTQQAAFSTANSSTAGQIAALNTTAGSNDAKLTAEIGARVDADSAFSTSLSNLSSSVVGSTAGFNTQISTLTTNNNAISAQTNALTANVGENKASLDTEIIARTTGDLSLSSSVTSLNNSFGQNSATINTQVATLVSNDTSFAGQLSTLSASTSDTSALLQQETATRASSDAAFAAQFTSLQTTVNNNKAAFDSQVITQADTNSAISGSVTTLSARAARNAASTSSTTFYSGTAPTRRIIFPPGINASVGGTSYIRDDLFPIVFVKNYNANIATPGNIQASILPIPSQYAFSDSQTMALQLLDNSTWVGGGVYRWMAFSKLGDNPELTPGDDYEFSVYTGAVNCYVVLEVAFYDANSNLLGSGYSDGSINGTVSGVYPGGVANANNNEKTGGSLLTDFKRLWMKVTAPPNASFASTNIYALNSVGINSGVFVSGGNNPRMFVTRPFFGRASAGQTSPSDWAPYQPPQWVNFLDNNRTYVWNGIQGLKWSDISDGRVASLQQNMLTAVDQNNAQYEWSIRGRADTVTGGIALRGARLRNPTTGVVTEYSNLIIDANTTINGNLVVNGTINTGQLADNSVSNSTGATSNSSSVSVTITLKASQRVSVIATCSSGGSSGGSCFVSYGLPQAPGGNYSSTLFTTVTPPGAASATIIGGVGSASFFESMSFSNNGGQVYLTVSQKTPPMTGLSVYTAPSDGSYVFTASNPNSGNVGILVIGLVK